MMQRPFRPEGCSLNQTTPHLGSGTAGDKHTTTYDLVEQMQYLYVRVVKAKDLPSKDVTESCDPYAEVKLGNYKGTTRYLEKKTNPEWNQVFAFSKEHIQASVVEVIVKDKDLVKDDFIGRVAFDLNEVPKRAPPDGPLASQWYRLEDRNGHKVKGELMLAVWMGTQADEAFPEAWHSDAALVHGDGLARIRSKVYLTPKLWFLRVNVIEAQDLVPSDKTRFPEVYVKAMLGNQALWTRISPSRTLNPMWNEDLMFVAAEPFEEHLIFSVEDRVAPGKDDVLGRTAISLQHVLRRLDQKLLNGQWFNLEKHVIVDGEQKKETESSGRIHLRICLEGRYHFLDESTHYSSDLRPTAKQLWKPSIGVLELGILTAPGLLPMKTKAGRGTTDAFCVAKYGQKWVRTRTIMDSFAPKWNEQYAWEVYDPIGVITIGVFDDCHYGEGTANACRDTQIGKVRIRLSTLETGRVYTHSYPLIDLLPSGVRKLGEVQLAVRLTCSSLLNMMHLYSQPLLPKTNYVHPLSLMQIDSLRRQATEIVLTRLSRAEPPLRKEIVEYMLAFFKEHPSRVPRCIYQPNSSSKGIPHFGDGSFSCTIAAKRLECSPNRDSMGVTPDPDELMRRALTKRKGGSISAPERSKAVVEEQTKKQKREAAELKAAALTVAGAVVPIVKGQTWPPAQPAPQGSSSALGTEPEFPGVEPEFLGTADAGSRSCQVGETSQDVATVEPSSDDSLGNTDYLDKMAKLLALPDVVGEFENSDILVSTASAVFKQSLTTAALAGLLRKQALHVQHAEETVQSAMNEKKVALDRVLKAAADLKETEERAQAMEAKFRELSEAALERDKARADLKSAKKEMEVGMERVREEMVAEVEKAKNELVAVKKEFELQAEQIKIDAVEAYKESEAYQDELAIVASGYMENAYTRCKKRVASLYPDLDLSRVDYELELQEAAKRAEARAEEELAATALDDRSSRTTSDLRAASVAHEAGAADHADPETQSAPLI